MKYVENQTRSKSQRRRQRLLSQIKENCQQPDHKMREVYVEGEIEKAYRQID